jgi:hypothetical protein
LGIQINNAGLHGINISEPQFVGLLLANPGSDGLFVSDAGDDGVEVAGVLTRIHVHDVMGRAGYFHNATSSNQDPLYLRHGDDSKMDVGFSGHARLTSNGAYVIYLDHNNNGMNQFEVVDSDINTMFSIYEDGNVFIKNQLRIPNSNTHALKLKIPQVTDLT